MANFNNEKNKLQVYGLLPSSRYFRSERFHTPFANEINFWGGLANPVVFALYNGLTTCYFAMQAVWATLRAVGNVFVLKFPEALDAIGDLCIHLSLSIGLAVMAPIHAIVNSIELLTGIVASWLSKESSHDLSNVGICSKFMGAQYLQAREDYLPSKKYFRNARFFTSYQGMKEGLDGAVSPVLTFGATVFSSLNHAHLAMYAALSCMVNLLIAKPKHAGEGFGDFGIHLTLSVSLAIMAPINTVVEAIAFMTRMGTTWVAACKDVAAHDQQEPARANYRQRTMCSPYSP